ncbi:MAG: hypothetical protein KatS3mg058_0874 [Roseiflexus sp.]|nr:MAG: hypothetical protein KatS3mg058_0874 [Roseiflexus sp.]
MLVIRRAATGHAARSEESERVAHDPSLCSGRPCRICTGHWHNTKTSRRHDAEGVSASERSSARVAPPPVTDCPAGIATSPLHRRRNVTTRAADNHPARVRRMGAGAPRKEPRFPLEPGPAKCYPTAVGTDRIRVAADDGVAGVSLYGAVGEYSSATTEAGTLPPVAGVSFCEAVGEIRRRMQ